MRESVCTPTDTQRHSRARTKSYIGPSVTREGVERKWVGRVHAAPSRALCSNNAKQGSDRPRLIEKLLESAASAEAGDLALNKKPPDLRGFSRRAREDSNL